MDIQKTIDYCLSLNYEKLEEFAKTNYQTIYNYLTTKKPAEKAKAILEGCVFTCISADANVGEEEFKLIKGLVGQYSDENLLKVLEDYKGFDAQETIKMLYDNLNEEMQNALINLSVAIFTVDKDLDFGEDYLLTLLTSKQDY